MAARAEYNSIKHGLRVNPGGSYIAVGAEQTPGVPAPPEAMRSMGGSPYGSTFFEIEHRAEEQAIQRYEATDYSSVSFARLVEIAEALELTIHYAVRLNQAG